MKTCMTITYILIDTPSVQVQDMWPPLLKKQLKELQTTTHTWIFTHMYTYVYVHICTPETTSNDKRHICMKLSVGESSHTLTEQTTTAPVILWSPPGYAQRVVCKSTTYIGGQTCDKIDQWKKVLASIPVSLKYENAADKQLVQRILKTVVDFLQNVEKSWIPQMLMIKS